MTGIVFVERGPREVVGRAVRLLCSLVLSLTLLLACTLAAGLGFGWWRAVPVETGSMSPTIPTGAVAIATPEPFTAVRVGQIIIYDPPTEGDSLLVHRVSTVVHGGSSPVIRTRGDANPAEDPWTAELQRPPVWRVHYVVPHLGRVVDLLRGGSLRLVLFAGAVGGMLLALLSTIAHIRAAGGAARRLVEAG